MTGRAFAAVLLVLVCDLAPANAPRTETNSRHQGRVALEGIIHSDQEGAMEGVVVSAKRDGGTITVSVVSNQNGAYQFPANRLAPGRYAISVRAIGYGLQSQGAADLVPGKATHANLQLVPVQDLATQLTSAEWILSAPGSRSQKSSLLQCAECHTLAMPMSSAHNAIEFEELVQRMLGAYAYQSVAGDVQLMPHPRALDLASVKALADYYASINLGTRARYRFPLQTLPRVRGKGTQVIITEYDLPRPMAQPHDVIVDPAGAVWYNDFARQVLGRLDPTTGKTREYKIPLVRVDRPTGSLAIENGIDGKIWIGMHLQAAIGLFDPKTKAFRIYPVPDALMQPNMQTSHISTSHESIDGKVWTSAGADAATRVDVKTGKYENFYPYSAMARSLGGVGSSANFDGDNKALRPVAASVPIVIYGIASDSKNDFIGTNFLSNSVVRVDARTGKVDKWDTTTPFSMPRQAQMDAQDRLWFAQYNANRLGMLDPKTGKIVDYVLKTPWTAPYDAVLDKNGFAWTAGMNSDRVVRINTKTGEQVDFQLPRTSNIRRVFVDNRPVRPVFWAGNNHGASIIKVEALD